MIEKYKKKTIKARKQMMAILTAVSFCLLSSFLNAAIYYVSPVGEDGSPGTIGSPWKTIDKANTTLQPGDTVYLRGGHYYKETIMPVNSGSSESGRITYAAYPGEIPVINFADTLGGWVKCGIDDAMNLPSAEAWPYNDPQAGSGTKTFPYGHFRGNYTATDGVDAIYKVQCSKSYYVIAEDDFATNGRDTHWWDKGRGNRQMKDKEIFLIVEKGEYFQHGGWIYARAADCRNPGNGFCRGLPSNSYGANLDGKKYITVSGIHVENVHYFVSVFEAQYVTIEDCSFRYAIGFSGISNLRTTETHHIIIRNCLIEGVNSFDLHGGDVINLDNNTHHILIEGNEIAWAGHGNLMAQNVQYCIFRNNLIRDGASAFRCDGYFSKFNLIEGNRIVRASPAWNLVKQHNADHPGLTIAGQGNIVRNNCLWDGPGIDITARMIGSNPSNCVNQKIYNNTLYGCKGAFITSIHISTWEPMESISKNVVINNIAYNGVYNKTEPDDIHFIKNARVHDNIITNNIFGTIGSRITASDKQYLEANNQIGTDPLIAGYESFTPDFHLAESSPAIDKGRFLTRSISSGSGTELPVVDPYFFCDGFGLIQGDLIQLQGQTDTARIVTIDHANKILNLDRSLSWDEGTGIGLPYKGSAPDIGAFESFYIGTGASKILRQQTGLRMNIFPNPSIQGNISVNYELPATSDVIIYILNEIGQSVHTLVNKNQGKGSHILEISTADYKQGMYFCKLITGDGNKAVAKFIVK